MTSSGRPAKGPTRQLKITISEARAQEFEREVERLNAVNPKGKLTLNTYCARKLDPPKITRPTSNYVEAKDCSHPVGRRIGSMCAACGTKVGK